MVSIFTRWAASFYGLAANSPGREGGTSASPLFRPYRCLSTTQWNDLLKDVAFVGGCVVGFIADGLLCARQQVANHASTRTKQHYDWYPKEISANEIERILLSSAIRRERSFSCVARMPLDGRTRSDADL